jgi:hypothetical protein
MIHLTHTSFMAGQTLCGVPREANDQYAHAVYAPLHRMEYRLGVCPCCLKEYALSYDSDEEKPEWAVSLLG